MRGLFDNIAYLIPIALFIVFRVLSAKSRENKKPPPKPQTGTSAEQGKYIRQKEEARKIPVYNKRTETRESYKPVLIHKKNAEKPVKKQTGINQIAVSDIGTLPVTQKEAAEKPPAVKPVSQLLETGFSFRGLSPLQQAVVWSEILGKPKGT